MLSASQKNVLTRRWLEEFGGLLGLRVSDLIGMEGIEKGVGGGGGIRLRARARRKLRNGRNTIHAQSSDSRRMARWKAFFTNGFRLTRSGSVRRPVICSTSVEGALHHPHLHLLLIRYLTQYRKVHTKDRLYHRCLQHVQ